MAVVAGLDNVAPVVIATPGILPYTLIPAANGKSAYTAFLLWRDRHTSSLSSSTFWGHMICPSIKTDNSALDTVCRTFSAKTRGIWGMDVGAIKYIQPGGKGRSKREQKEDADESHSRIRTKIVSGKGTTLISTPHHLIYILPIRYIDINIINAWFRDEGECTWIPSQDLFTAFRSDSTNANLTVNTHAIDDVTRQCSYPLYLPFSASIRTPETMREILEILSQFEATLNTSTTIASSTPSTSTSTSTSTPTCIYTCRKCRTRCFTDLDLVPHVPQQSYAPVFAGKRRDMVSVIQCSSHFIEPVSTLGEFSEASGPILCPNPKCRGRIGDYDWAGSQCSCGEWITPALQITQSKVDRKMLNMANVIHVKPLPEQKMIDQMKTMDLDEKTPEASTATTSISSTTSAATSSPATEPVSSTTVIDPIHTPSSSPAITAT